MIKQKIFSKLIKLSICATLVVACQPKAEEEETAGRYLYVTSGVCYSGGNTTFTNLTASNKVFRINLATGVQDAILADYKSSIYNIGDSPTSIVDGGPDSVYVLVENATSTASRRIEKLQKKHASERSAPISDNTTVLSAALKNFFMTPSGDFIISKTTGIEYLVAATDQRLGTAVFSTPNTAPCASSSTIITKLERLKNGNIAFLHATANQNRIGVLPANGGNTCLAVQAAPVPASSFPSAMFYDAANSKLVVAYSGNSATTADLNSIYAYDINETTGVLSNPRKLYDAQGFPATYHYLLYGISDMHYDAQNSTVYVASAITATTTLASSNYKIEKFTYNPAMFGVDNNAVLNRATTTPYFPHSADTQCISDMMIAD